jgi:hypothetical protein
MIFKGDIYATPSQPIVSASQNSDKAVGLSAFTWRCIAPNGSAAIPLGNVAYTLAVWHGGQ